MITRDLHAAIEAFPRFTIAAGMKADDMAVIAQTHPHARAVWIGRAAALDAVLMRDEILVVKAKAAIELLVVEQ